MGPKLKVAILSHANDPFLSRTYVLRHMVEPWQAAGHNVLVLLGPQVFQSADIAVMHVSLTILPEEYRMFARNYPVVVNGQVADVSKRRISRNLVDRADDYSGAVIVKTNRNFGGMPEQRLLKAGRPSRLRKLIHRATPWFWRSQLASGDYRIFPAVRDIPGPVWNNPHLVVEKYLPERDGDHYCLRQWLFFGDREISQRVFSLHSVVKAGNIVRREDNIPVPDELRAMRHDLGFDYGKFDYVLVDGRVVLFDVNNTPTMNPKRVPSEKLQRFAGHLAAGLGSFATGRTGSLLTGRAR